MPIRFLILSAVLVAFSGSLHAQSGQTGKPVIANVDNNQPTLAPAADLTVLENKLGIGTATPVFKLDVVGQINGSGGLCMGGDCRTTWPAGTSGPWTVSGTSLLYGDGNVGIGSSSPAYKLDVTGQVNASGGMCISGDCRTSWPSTTSSWTTSGANIGFTAGSVGIGTTTPTRFFQVDRPTGNPQIGLYTNGVERVVLTGTTDGKFHIDTGNNPRVTVDGPGNVGIGTTSPRTLLNLLGSDKGTTNLYSAGNLDVLVGDATAAGKGGSITLGGRVGTTNGISGFASIKGAKTNATDEDFDGYLSLYTTKTGIGSREWLRVTADGNVGIGTTSPAHKLHVVGNVRVDGNISALYQDVAEWVEATAPLTDGTVVVLHPSRPNVVSEATAAYDTRVAGAVSGQPGVLLGEAADNKELVAQSGRVRIKVDASFGPIAIGDLLVTSPTAGHAMRSTPVDIGGVQLHRPGTLLGKALESLASGRGEILVLLTLQ